MEHYASLFVNTALIFSCTFMAVVFLLLPLPSGKGIRKYRFSLRFLAGAFLIMALFTTYKVVFDVNTVNMIPIGRLIIATLQAPLFTFTLIALINPGLITRKYLYKQFIPLTCLIILYILAAANWGDPIILTFTELQLYSLHPTVIVRELVVIFYTVQLVWLIREFSLQVRRYEEKINNFFSDSLKLQLPWVKYCFYAALSVGIFVLFSCFVFTEQMAFGFNIFCIFFYLVFGFYYIQYPRTFLYIEPAIVQQPAGVEDVTKFSKHYDWNEFKQIILETKYYLSPGVTIEDMARYLKIGRTMLSHYINNKEGMNFNMWINSLRIEDAKKLLLEHPDYTMTFIAEQVGYSEHSNFSRQFKLITNQSPSIWRQTHQS